MDIEQVKPGQKVKVNQEFYRVISVGKNRVFCRAEADETEGSFKPDNLKLIREYPDVYANVYPEGIGVWSLQDSSLSKDSVRIAVIHLAADGTLTLTDV